MMKSLLLLETIRLNRRDSLQSEIWIIDNESKIYKEIYLNNTNYEK